MTSAHSHGPGVGHVPQLQVPRQLAEHVLAWMDDALRPRRARGPLQAEAGRPTTINSWGNKPGPPTDDGKVPTPRKSAGHPTTAAAYPRAALVNTIR
jgi:hypothetical protein